MPKFVPEVIDTLRNDATAVGSINANFQALASIVENFLSRDGTSPNTMNAVFDMNNQRLVNLPFPLSPSEPARLSDITDASADIAELFEQAEDILDEAIETADSIIPAAEAAQAAAETAADNAQTSADEAAAFALDAANELNKLIGTSSTSNSIGTGTKTFTTQTGKNFVVGNYVIATRGTTDFMWGQVTSYSGTTLELNVSATSGSGTYTDWTLSASAPRGPQGPTGATGPVGAGSGDVNGPASATDGAFALFDDVTGKLLKNSGVIPGSLAAANSINNSNWSGTDLALIHGGTGASLTDPGADRIMFWDTSGNTVDWLAPSGGLGISGTNLTITDAELSAIAGLTSAADSLPYFTGSGTASLATFTSTARSLLDDASTSAMRTTLGLGNVDNTSDANKPVSTAVSTALADKQDAGNATTGYIYNNTTSFTPLQPGKIYVCTGNLNVVIPSAATTASQGWSVGTYFLFYCNGGTQTFLANSGSILRTPTGSKLTGLGSMCVLIMAFPDIWVAQGAMIS